MDVVFLIWWQLQSPMALLLQLLRRYCGNARSLHTFTIKAPQDLWILLTINRLVHLHTRLYKLTSTMSTQTHTQVFTKLEVQQDRPHVASLSSSWSRMMTREQTHARGFTQFRFPLKPRPRPVSHTSLQTRW